uniref:Innexin n=1 Tax=Acrobeloides nanus TaxID=290746 RepID=A0A914DW88_9BILA
MFLATLFNSKSIFDRTARLNFVVTPVLLLIFAVIVFSKLYVGNPIECMTPNQFTDDKKQYAEGICLLSTYVIPLEHIPSEIGDHQSLEISYLRWIPFILALQALMFYAPKLLWDSWHCQSGIDINSIMYDIQRICALTYEERQNEILTLVSHIKNHLLHARRRILSICYILTKTLSLINLLVQFLLINYYFGLWKISWEDIDGYGLQAFPKISFCDLQWRNLGQINRFTIQCFLSVNTFNEFIYVTLWFWILFLTIITLINFIYELIILFNQKMQDKMLRHHLKREKQQNPEFSNNFEVVFNRVFTNGISSDIILFIRFIERYSGTIMADDFCAQLLAQHTQNDYVENVPTNPSAYKLLSTKESDRTHD